MARKERNNVDYFPHSVSHGRKMFYLRSKYKNDGYAVWFMLLEQLGKSDFHYLDLSDKTQLMYLSAELMVDENTLMDIIKILVDFNEFDSDLWSENRILFNEKFIENISDAYKKRNNSCIDKKSLLLLLNSKGKSLLDKSIPKLSKSTSEVPDNTQSKVKKSKEDKFITQVVPTSAVDYEKFISVFNSFSKRNFKVTDKVKKSLNARLEKYSKDEILLAIKNAHSDSYHKENNFKYLTPEFILRPDKLDKFLNQITNSNQGYSPQLTN